MFRVVNITGLVNTLHSCRAVTHWEQPSTVLRGFHVSAARLKRRKTAEEKVGFRAAAALALKL